jgi:hypothetical protein
MLKVGVNTIYGGLYYFKCIILTELYRGIGILYVLCILCIKSAFFADFVCMVCIMYNITQGVTPFSGKVTPIKVIKNY